MKKRNSIKSENEKLLLDSYPIMRQVLGKENIKVVQRLRRLAANWDPVNDVRRLIKLIKFLTKVHFVCQHQILLRPVSIEWNFNEPLVNNPHF